ncbi:MAG: UDP-N-acetylglucosamine 1-carboxyvinyltransferase, partial [Lachnospiraceae bacterium]|nr:UDP-N-acetylglucosamine 1-carboxyvinyltransferase [Lachnospiraceae bacterium]
GAKVRALDLRSGAALIIAGLMAQGTTIVENADCILRGYEHIDRDLQELAAVVEFVSEE